MAEVSDEDVRQEVRRILEGADLDSISERKIKDEITKKHGHIERYKDVIRVSHTFSSSLNNKKLKGKGGDGLPSEATRIGTRLLRHAGGGGVFSRVYRGARGGGRGQATWDQAQGCRQCR